MKPLWHRALEPEFPARPRTLPAWTTWIVLGFLIAIGVGVVYGFWATTTHYAVQRSLTR
jgi:hypothetical protein